MESPSRLSISPFTLNIKLNDERLSYEKMNTIYKQVFLNITMIWLIIIFIFWIIFESQRDFENKKWLLVSCYLIFCIFLLFFIKFLKNNLIFDLLFSYVICSLEYFSNRTQFL